MANGDATGTGGLSVPLEMQALLRQPGFIGLPKGSMKTRNLHTKGLLRFDPGKLGLLAVSCFTGDLEGVKRIVSSSPKPDLAATETPYLLGYCTLVIFGAQRLDTSPPGACLFKETLTYLLEQGCNPSLPDIVGYTALHHATMNVASIPPLARILLSHGAQVDAQDRFGCVPLLYAMQTNQVPAMDLLLEHKAKMDIADADGASPKSMYLVFGPEVTTCVRCWERSRSGENANMTDKRCNGCGKAPPSGTTLKICSRCRKARYCSSECQKNVWKQHKSGCIPFSDENTVTVKPSYEGIGSLFSMSSMMCDHTGLADRSTPQRHSSRGKGWLAPAKSKDMVIKVQVPFDNSKIPLLLYNKSRDFTCTISCENGAEQYEQVAQVVRAKGVGGAKAYFAAELKRKDELVIKIGEVVAEQPF